ncbi:STE3-domain-containing protein [Massarina eburnea CBS 473.64]|uniref:STE3-domain-containing protein n=1 Tax=Massarina eburnea CBS 473.64 TaxID=1395130 RepID=A0A6A6RV48_9PLEO|nr:STE3-domain-containing protein [Massarina eburnea CBS 473.64]
MTEGILPLTYRNDEIGATSNVNPIYASAVIVPVLAFPACFLCIPPMIWHFNQKNIAAGSLMLWLGFLNFFNAINPLIWPRDNISEWWKGDGLCDVQVRIQVGATVAITSCIVVIARRLSNVMDTRNITVAPSKSSRVSERVLEIVCCWVIPILIMIVYYVVQRARYFIFAISGCTAAFDASWPSIVLVWIWGPIAACIAFYYAGLLIWRLYRYRREFSRLITARNTSKSRFIRLFCMSVIFVSVVTPYQIFLLVQLASTVTLKFQWSRVHGADWNSVIMVPTAGAVRYDRWGEIAFGYVLFVLFGTGTDANNSYKRMFTSIGLGRIFPSLYIMDEGGSSMSASMSFIKGWTSKAKGLFSKGYATDDTFTSSAMDSPTTTRSMSLQPTPTNEPILPQRPQQDRSLFSRIFSRSKVQKPTILPLSTVNSGNSHSSKSPVRFMPPGIYAHSWPGIYAHAWSEVNEPKERTTGTGGVHVVREVTQVHQQKGKKRVTDEEAGF